MIRLFFHYRQAKGKYHRPLLEMPGIENYQRITEDLIDLVRRSALYSSYRKALKIGGHICALSTLWPAVQKEDTAYRKKRDNAVYYYLEGMPSASNLVWISHIMVLTDGCKMGKNFCAFRQIQAHSLIVLLV